MSLKEKLVEESGKTDSTFARLKTAKLDRYLITFPVPTNHPRRSQIKSYLLIQGRIDEIDYTAAHVIIDNRLLEQGFIKNISSSWEKTVLASNEASVKNKDYVDSKLSEVRDASRIIGMGGGLICNVATYFAEQLQTDLILIPTTVLSMADCSGGKVRLNQEINGRFYKHYVKSFYEPNAMILDHRFLKNLPRNQVSIGMVEIIKHGLFQSETLFSYLMSESERIFNKDNYYLKKAILWAADLKRVCLKIDSEEQEYGSKSILRAGHDISDRLEEESNLRIPHGLAVAYGIIKTLESQQESRKLALAKEIFRRYEIPYEREDFINFFK